MSSTLSNQLGNITFRLGTLVILIATAGCQGKSLVDDNPVFAEAPPRGALTNRSTEVAETASDSPILPVSLARSQDHLGGNSVVAEVNGTPVFVDDLIGSVRLAVEADPRLSDEQRQQIMQNQIRARLDDYVEQEIVLHALNKAVPPDKQQLIDDELESHFQEIVADIKAKNEVTTDAQLNEILANEGVSIDLLRESFLRIQKSQGYVAQLAKAPEQAARPEIVEYYLANTDEFTNEERVRWQELTVYFDNDTELAEAEQTMSTVLQKLRAGADFGDLAADYSQTLSAEKRGDMGWLVPGSLADKKLESQLMSMKTGQMTDVMRREDHLEILRVAEHQYAETRPLADVQQQIEQTLMQKKRQQARRDLLDKLKSQATVVTIFDDENEAESRSAFKTPQL